MTLGCSFNKPLLWIWGPEFWYHRIAEW